MFSLDSHTPSVKAMTLIFKTLPSLGCLNLTPAKAEAELRGELALKGSVRWAHGAGGWCQHPPALAPGRRGLSPSHPPSSPAVGVTARHGLRGITSQAFASTTTTKNDNASPLRAEVLKINSHLGFCNAF